MHARTEATLQELRLQPWFSHVGARDTTAACVLSSWNEAIDACSSLEWENLCLEAANQYRQRVFERSPERFANWNSIALEIKPAAQALVRDKTRKVIEQNSLPKTFVDTVDWDIVHLCMESEFAEVYPPGFFASQAYWYMKGHFPCGWKGIFPEGRLIIF